MASLLPKFRIPPCPPHALASLCKSWPRAPHLQSTPSSRNPDHFINPSPNPIPCFQDYDQAESALIRFFPSFPQLLNLNPFPLSGIVMPDAHSICSAEGDGRTLWADSVKKKRKRKMNKHKYRKLRKRLRRLT